MDDKNKLVIENMDTIKSLVWIMMKKFGIPKNEYEDYLQEAYLIILRKADKYNPEKKFSNFANTVIKNRFIDLYKMNRQPSAGFVSLEQSITEDEDGSDLTIMDFLKSDIDIENDTLQNITVDLMKEYIAQAKSDCTAKTVVKGFEALELRIKGYNSVEIAEMFHMPSNSLRSGISRAKKLLMNDDRVMALLGNI